MLFLYEDLDGQLCNRLWSFVPAYAFAKRHRKRLHILFENPEYVSLFPNANRDKYLRFWFTSAFWHRVRFMTKIRSFLLNRQIHGELRACNLKPFRLYSVNGWEHRGDVSYTDDDAIKQSLRHIFAFSDEVQKKVEDTFGEFNGVTIGLHVRRGDYRQWKDGRYCYDDDTWIRVMYSIKEQISSCGEQCRFLIASNEQWTYNDKDLDIVRIPDADGITDLCALSKCDYIIGPPSTYSQWASFMGNVPLHFLLSSDEKLDMNDFSPIVRQDVFADGRKLQWSVDENCFILK